MASDHLSLDHSLPFELVDMIIGHVHDDPPALASCSLVCRDWLVPARHYLFSKTKLGPKNARRFADVISSPFSTIIPWIRHLDAKDNYENSGWLTEVFPTLICLTSVTTISITSSCDTPLTQQTLRALCSFENLIELVLVDCAFGDFEEVQALICSFPHLQRLHLDGAWPAPRGTGSTTIRPPPALRELYLRGEMTHVLGWFLTLSPVPLVQHLVLHGLSATQLTSVNRYLQALGPALTHLTLPPFNSVYQCLYRGLDLSNNCHLQYIKLMIDCDSVNLAFAKQILSRVDSPRIAELELSFYSLRQTQQNHSDWEELDCLLTQPQYSSLTTVTVEAIAVLSKVEAILPRCYHHSILRVRAVLNASVSLSQLLERQSGITSGYKRL